MTHGTPDWGHGKQEVTFALVDDLAELAVRLGSISIFDRRGSVAWQDSFEYGLAPYITYEMGTGAEVVQSSASFLHGGYSCKLTGGSDGAQYAAISHNEPRFLSGKVGLQCAFSIATYIDYFELWCRTYTGTELYNIAARYDDVNGKLLILVESNTWTEIVALSPPASRLNVFNRLKLVGDVTTGYYTRVLLNGIEYDISEHLIDVATTTNPAEVLLWARVFSRDGENDVAYVDSIILTQNEP